MTTTLQCLGDAEVPAELVADLRVVGKLDAGARDAFWLLLSTAIDEQPARLDPLLEAFGTRYGVAPEDLARTVNAHRFMLREASLQGADPTAYAADLRRVAASEEEGDRLMGLLLPAFGPAMKQLEDERVVRAIADHGSVVVGVRWRVDRMVASHRGDPADKRVGMMTLELREAGQRKQVTVQILPDMMQRLANACLAMIRA